MAKVYISYEEDYPSWSDYLLAERTKGDIDTFIDNLITAIEWCSNKRVKAIKIEEETQDRSFKRVR